MKIQEKVNKYIKNTEISLKNVKINDGLSIDYALIQKVIAESKRYYEDAKYFMKKNMYETSLTAISYCEGLLEALKILGFIK